MDEWFLPLQSDKCLLPKKKTVFLGAMKEPWWCWHACGDAWCKIASGLWVHVFVQETIFIINWRLHNI